MPSLFLLGLVVLMLWNWHQWRWDRALALQLRAQPGFSEPASAGEDPPLPQAPAPHLPLVSVLVAAWNEAELIARHIASFAALRYPHKELILCAGGDDGTLRLAREQQGERITVLEQQPGEGKQRALQRCLQQARGDIIFLTDADCLLDDDSFQRTLAPLLREGENVATGASQPLHEQQSQPFVLHQWCTDLYASARHPPYATAVLGRNCAVEREALQSVGGFSARVQTGTDYHLGRLLLRRGERIRYVRDSAIETHYPEALRSYWRKQSRWVRNVLVHGPAFGAHDEVRAALTTGLAGMVMLGLPALAGTATFLGGQALARLLLGAWGLLLAHAFLAKLRYAAFARLYQGMTIHSRQLALTPLYLLVDFVAWVAPLVDRVLRPQQW